MMRILVLGAGLQGRAALHDLAQSEGVSHVIAADADLSGVSRFVDSLKAGREKIELIQLDAHDRAQVSSLMQAADAVIVLLPVAFHAAIARLAVENGIHLINSSYPPPEFQEIGRAAEARNLTILPEFGLDPGIDLVLAGKAIRDFDESDPSHSGRIRIHQFYSYGAGFPEPQAATGPLRYKITWTLDGVLKSYHRDARVIRDGKVVDIPGREIFAPSNTHTVEMQEWGSFEAYPNGDILHYLEMMGIAKTVREAGRFAMRYPGHCAFWYTLAQLGFLEDKPISAGGASIAPREFVRALLEPQLQFADRERDVALIRVDVRGVKNGRKIRRVHQVIDRRDLSTGLMAMNRTVGYTASIGAQMILRGDIQKRGLLSPLTDVDADLFFKELAKRGITVQQFEYAEK